MKHKYFFVALLFILFMVVGCTSNTEKEQEISNKEKSKELICTRKATVSEGVSMDLYYKVTYKGKYVELIETQEKIISDDKSILEIYKNTIESTYSPYKDVEYYDYDVKINGNTLTSTTKINYLKIDTDKMIDIDSANATMIKNGKVLVEDIKNLYSSIGAICE